MQSAGQEAPDVNWMRVDIGPVSAVYCGLEEDRPPDGGSTNEAGDEQTWPLVLA